MGRVCARATWEPLAASRACPETPGAAEMRGRARSPGVPRPPSAALGQRLGGGQCKRGPGNKKAWLPTSGDAQSGQKLRGKQVLVAIWKTESSNSGVCAPAVIGKEGCGYAADWILETKELDGGRGVLALEGTSRGKPGRNSGFQSAAYYVPDALKTRSL